MMSYTIYPDKHVLCETALIKCNIHTRKCQDFMLHKIWFIHFLFGSPYHALLEMPAYIARRNSARTV